MQAIAGDGTAYDRCCGSGGVLVLLLRMLHRGAGPGRVVALGLFEGLVGDPGVAGRGCRGCRGVSRGVAGSGVAERLGQPAS